MVEWFTVVVSLVVGLGAAVLAAYSKVWAQMAYEKWTHQRDLRNTEILFDSLSADARKIVLSAYKAGMPFQPNIADGQYWIGQGLLSMGLIVFNGSENLRAFSLSPLALECIISRERQDGDKQNDVRDD